MATFQIWEVYSSGNAHEQVAMLPGGAVQNITISAAHAESAAFDNATIGVQVQTDTDCWFLCSKAGTAATSSNGIRLTAAQGMVYYGVPMAGAYKISIVTA